MALGMFRGIAAARRIGQGIKQGARTASRTKQLGKINKTRMASGFADDAAAAAAGGNNRFAGGLLGGLMSPGGALVTGGVFAAPFIAGARDSFIEDQYSTGRGIGKSYDSGFLGIAKPLQAIGVLPDEAELDVKRKDYLRRQYTEGINKLQSAGMFEEAEAALNPRLSNEQVAAKIAADMPEAEVNIAIKKANLEDASPRGQRALARERRAENLQNYQITESINMTRRQLEAGIDQASRQLSQSELALQLAGQQQERQQALDLYREQNRADERKYRDRLELMQGLSTLAMGAFS